MADVEPEVLLALDLHANLGVDSNVPRALLLVHEQRRRLAELDMRIRNAVFLTALLPWQPPPGEHKA